MVGNLLFFRGAEKINAYSEFLHSLGPLLLLARLILISAVVLHVVAAYQLTRMSLESRPDPYARWKDEGSNYASRTMRWSGPILLLFIIYHVLDFTLGRTNPDYVPGNIYHNVIASFSIWYISAFYILAMVALGIHLFHGAWSMFQSMGLNSPKYDPWLRRLAILFTILIVVGFVSVPIAVMLGYTS
jgi:succinate dehydrogenase / fumarate reductase cytochrome b subunit